jgi:hypothetical protein
LLFDINRSQRQARARLDRVSLRKRRSDAGRSRLSEVVLSELRAAALGDDRPSMAALQRLVSERCLSAGLKPPVRASLYNALARLDGHVYSVATLPLPVVEALYNIAPDGRVPGHQLAFYCFNYGSLGAISYAAGLPWLDLYQARRLRGWRPRSFGLLLAVMRRRGL